MPEVTVVCPVLNVRSYIEEMMDSIINQTLKDIEIIVVDAGSTDGTLEVLQEYSEKDNRVKLLKSPQKSMGYQYNMGIDAATGKWIGFVEGDDYIAYDMFEKLCVTAQKTEADIVKARFDMFFDTEEGERIFLTCSQLTNAKRELYNQIIVPKEYGEMLLRDINIWNGIYKREFLKKKGIRFNETPGAAFQDMDFNMQTFILADTLIYREESFYRYRRDNQLSSVYSDKALKFVIDEFYFIKQFLDNVGECSVSFKAAVGLRIFALFGGCYGKVEADFMKNEENERVVKNFVKEFLEFYHSIRDSELSQYNFKQSLEIEILSKSTEQFRKYMHLRAQTDKKALIEYLAFLREQKQIIIFGCGERGSSTYAFLKRNCINGVVGFCDNGKTLWNQILMGKKIISPKEAVEKYPNACYLLANDTAFLDMKRQLQKMGIVGGQIYKSVPIEPHSAMENKVV